MAGPSTTVFNLEQGGFSIPDSSDRQLAVACWKLAAMRLRQGQRTGIGKLCRCQDLRRTDMFGSDKTEIVRPEPVEPALGQDSPWNGVVAEVLGEQGSHRRIHRLSHNEVETL
ncbi:hypothetical protein [Paenirhodobacter populi]|uniref:Uncharacterized protein n=1 Tax=Paenirhodobacter populi TaxID=2306993 RepID=A0A443JGE2_9RHOB|nr:hypothetical protein [Sinirhodobacter populi]RWR19578.1 hypothetical protein D2T30_13795 [Sinirhodobacter populi]